MAEAICILLAMNINKSIQEGQVPPGWKNVHVTALHKKEENQIQKTTDQ